MSDDKPPPFTSVIEDELAPATAGKPMADPDWSPGGTAGAEDEGEASNGGNPGAQKEEGIPMNFENEADFWVAEKLR